jgi:DNA-binding protein HU-beta
MANREEVVRKTAQISGMTLSQTNALYDAFVMAITELLKECGTVKLANIGRLRVKETKEKPCRDIRTGKTIIIPPRKVVKFSASPLLNNKMDHD